MDPKYFRADFNSLLAHAVEESGEFIQAAGKTQRFGRISINPELKPGDAHYGETNQEWVVREMKDLDRALTRLDIFLTGGNEGARTCPKCTESFAATHTQCGACGHVFYDDPSLASVSYVKTSVVEIEKLKGKPYSRLHATTQLTEQLANALAKMRAALASTMPGVKHIAVQDYALLNDAPLEAQAALDAYNEARRRG